MTRQPANPRPLSPHLQIWRWHPTMASSILHRASGVINYVGAILITIWLVLLAAGPQAYAVYDSLLLGPPGVLVRLVLFSFTLSLTYHLLNGVRHLIWDLGKGFDPGGSNTRSMAIFATAIIIPVAIWILAGGFF